MTSATSGLMRSAWLSALVELLLEVDRRAAGSSAAARSCESRALRRAWLRSARAGTGPPPAPRAARPCPRTPGRCRVPSCRSRSRHAPVRARGRARRVSSGSAGRPGLIRRRSNTGTPRATSRRSPPAAPRAKARRRCRSGRARPRAGCRRGSGAGRSLAVDHERVAGVVTALEAHHRGGALGEQIDDLALAFVAPLGADHDERCDP